MLQNQLRGFMRSLSPIRRWKPPIIKVSAMCTRKQRCAKVGEPVRVKLEPSVECEVEVLVGEFGRKLEGDGAVGGGARFFKRKPMTNGQS